MITFVRLLADAWQLFRREADLIVRVAAPFLFVPAFALLLLTDPFPRWPGAGADDAATTAWLRAFEAWGNANVHWYLLAAAIGIYGQAVIATLLLERDRPTVGVALRQAGGRFPRFVLASALANLATGLGFLCLILPGLFLYARLATIVPIVVAEPGTSAAKSIARSIRVTTGATFAILGALLMLLVIQWLMIAPLAPVDAWLRLPGHANPFVIALVDALVAAIDAAHNVFVLLVGIVAYRRLASRGI